jgi:ATP-binding cassette subfamily C protein
MADIKRACPRGEVRAETSMDSEQFKPRPQAPTNFRKHSELREALNSCRHAFLGVGLFSGLINLLYLTGPLFMLEVYDRVLPSRSVPTLVGLVGVVGVIFAFQGFLDLIRGRMFSRIGAALDERLSQRVFNALVRLPLKGRSSGDGLQPLRDLDQVRSFLSGGGPLALFDLPWMPLYLAMCFLFHFLIGTAALFGAAVLIIVTILTEMLTRRPLREAAGFSISRSTIAGACRRNTEAVQAMGMGPQMTDAWGKSNSAYMTSQQRASDVASGFGALSKVLRLMLQSGVLGLGAYLVLNQEATAGIIIASSILVSRALQPVELAIANWRGFLGARQSWRRLNELLTALPAGELPLPLPRPKKSLSVEAISIVPPGTQRLVVQDMSFRLSSGQGLGIIGPSASGKSSLARAIVGVWVPVRGKVRYDGAALEQWSPEMLGRHVGYLPQDVELFDGTVAQNVSRFEGEPDPDKIIAAAQTAGVHDIILRLPEGYETRIGEGGAALSGGQRQLLGLARALYSDPFLVVLDEPNSNLDAEGEKALTEAIRGVRSRGGIIIVIAHRPSAVVAVDQLLVMADGRMKALGPKEEILSQINRPSLVPTAPLKIVAEGSGS